MNNNPVVANPKCEDLIDGKLMGVVEELAQAIRVDEIINLYLNGIE